MGGGNTSTYCCFSPARTGTEHMACHTALFWRDGGRGLWDPRNRKALNYHSFENWKEYIYLLLGSDAPPPTQIKNC